MAKRIGEHFRGNVVAYVALFFALGGSAYAVTALDKNSVRSKHIKNGQVKSPDVKNNGLKGRDINESSLGTVPNAANADNLDGEDSSAFQTKGSEGWSPAALNDDPSGLFCDWTNYGQGFDNASYLRDQDGFVHLRGMVRSNDGSDLPCVEAFSQDLTIVRLPDGYWPASRKLFTVSSNNKPGRVDVNPFGYVTKEPGYPGFADAKQWLSLDGITFRCAPSGVDGCP